MEKKQSAQGINRMDGIYSHCVKTWHGTLGLLSVYLVGGNAAYICQALSPAFNFTGRPRR